MLRLEHILKEERKESLDLKSSRAVECSLGKRARGGTGGKETGDFTRSERRDYKGKDNEKSFHTVSRGEKKNEDKVHAI